MRAIGIVRKVDPLGRIVIPKEVRKIFEIEEGTALEIYTSENTIVLKKYDPQCKCIFCGEGKFVIEFKNKKICTNCIETISK